MAIVTVCLGTQASTATVLVPQATMVRTVPTSAVVPRRRLLAAVTHLMAPVTASQVSLDHTVTSRAQLADGVQTVHSLALVLMDHVTLYLETALAIEVGRDCYATKPVPAVAGHVQDVTMVMDHVIKPLGSASAHQATREMHVWRLAMQAILVRSARGNVIVLMAHLVIT